ncbi:MFS general substrate transporter-1 [Coleophoma crateriformis]|uniref:MFS general substrate transporter-1 n=1 Tax=Coleophoma crateriformis TaxID=565419 RepID=A0A3D8R2L2_9HELO|nr:MFS general substrate transporter-1 [Coleophoma crateriformis]
MANSLTTVVVPGTVHLVDLNEELHTGHLSSNKEIILIPRPSSDPEDPLNWSRQRKHIAVGCAYLHIFGIGIASAVQYSILDNISADTGITLAELNTGTGLMFLFLGWSCLFWQPIALVYGRRGVYVLSCFLCIIPMVWSAYSKTKAEWYAHRILFGLFGSSVESLPEVTVPDLFFAHERGTYMGIYAFLLFGSNFLAPFFAGFINDGVGWRWVMHFGSITLAVTGILLFFFMEDTIYFRSTFEGLDDDPRTSITQHSTVGNGIEVMEKTTSKPQAPVPGKNVSGVLNYSPVSEHTFPPPKTYIQKLALFVKLDGRLTKKQLFTMMYRPLLIFYHFPITTWCGFLYGTNLSWYNVMNGTTSLILGGAPYNFQAKYVGCAYLSPFIGAAVASVWSGQIADKLTLRLARKNGGVREPEQRLWSMLLPAIIGPAGLILWGVGADHGIHFMGLIIGLGMLVFGLICASSISLSYDVDCFKDLAGETMIAVIIFRNTLGFGFSYAITPWINAQGLTKTFVAVGMISLVCTSSFLAMIKFGKALRRFSTTKYWEYVATSAVAGH